MEVWSNGVRDFQVELLKYAPQHFIAPILQYSTPKPVHSTPHPATVDQEHRTMYVIGGVRRQEDYRAH